MVAEDDEKVKENEESEGIDEEVHHGTGCLRERKEGVTLQESNAIFTECQRLLCNVHTVFGQSISQANFKTPLSADSGGEYR